jgi:hypothetical protein
MRPYANSSLTLSIVAEKERELSNLSLRLKASDLSMTQARIAKKTKKITKKKTEPKNCNENDTNNNNNIGKVII